MAMWDVDLTTRMGAQTATRMGGTAAFIFAVLGVLGALLYGYVLNTGNRPEAVANVIAGLLEALIGVIAGFRLRAGKGLIWGGIAATLCLVEVVVKLVQLMIGGGTVIGVVTLVYLVNGVRGAYVLRQNRFDEDDAEAFA